MHPLSTRVKKKVSRARSVTQEPAVVRFNKNHVIFERKKKFPVKQKNLWFQSKIKIKTFQLIYKYNATMQVTVKTNLNRNFIMVKKVPKSKEVSFLFYNKGI